MATKSRCCCPMPCHPMPSHVCPPPCFFLLIVIRHRVVAPFNEQCPRALFQGFQRGVRALLRSLRDSSVVHVAKPDWTYRRTMHLDVNFDGTFYGFILWFAMHLIIFRFLQNTWQNSYLSLEVAEREIPGAGRTRANERCTVRRFGR